MGGGGVGGDVIRDAPGPQGEKARRRKKCGGAKSAGAQKVRGRKKRGAKKYHPENMPLLAEYANYGDWGNE